LYVRDVAPRPRRRPLTLKTHRCPIYLRRPRHAVHEYVEDGKKKKMIPKKAEMR
jgi:hypothetical protein